ncbi:GTPase Era, mitochondrial [Condylostylus longicornis]|uniref:GTPase Era, mitochondrial n=1 Tax=Condylostylus longicornis TaxID=2530218 RepID=UPI00244E3B16|nr:GTPase Era, mitochondrial [Condylostylus longicornis]
MPTTLGRFSLLNLFHRSPLVGNLSILSNLNYCTKQNHTEQGFEDVGQKLLRVAVIGVPNAGKSTFINNLINHRVCPTSNKVHTTRRSNRAVYTEKDTQIVLIDTPGLVTKTEMQKYNLGKKFSSSYRDSIQKSDIIAVVHDVSNSWTRNEFHPTVLETLNFYSKMPSFLILNKIDLLKSKRVLLDLIKILTNNTLSKSKKPIYKKSLSYDMDKSKEVGWSSFSNIFLVSAVTGDGLSEVMKWLLHEAKNEKWLFPAGTFTDETQEDIIVESVRARLLDYLPQEIPYKLQTTLEYFNEEKNIIYASVQVACPNLRLERLFRGESNGKLKQITERITSDLVETFNKPISLTITTTISKSEKILVN